MGYKKNNEKYMAIFAKLIEMRKQSFHFEDREKQHAFTSEVVELENLLRETMLKKMDKNVVSDLLEQYDKQADQLRTKYPFNEKTERSAREEEEKDKRFKEELKKEDKKKRQEKKTRKKEMKIKQKKKIN